MRLLIALPFLLLVLLFALSNRQVVELGLWPLAETVSMPLSLATLTLMALSFLAGAVVAWTGGLRHWRRARHAERQIGLLQARIDGLTPPAVDEKSLITIEHGTAV
jgi:putative membrane protein